MPLIFYGTPPGKKKRRLYAPSLRPIEGKVFNHLKVEGLAPDREKAYLAYYWWIRNHTALAWYDADGEEQAVFMPSYLLPFYALSLARQEFPSLIPSPTLFRILNEEEPQRYDCFD